MADSCPSPEESFWGTVFIPATTPTSISILLIAQTCLIVVLAFYYFWSSSMKPKIGTWFWRRQKSRRIGKGKTIDPVPRHGGDLVAEVLVQHGVEFVFCLAGGHISPILVGCRRRQIRVVDVRHEANAVFAADAVSRLSRQVGVACVTAGPGVTNTLTAIQNAYMAQSPLVLLGGATLGLLKDKGSLQDINQQCFFQTCIKWQASVNKIADIIPTLEEAFFQATHGVPGPVFVELPLDALYPESYIRAQVLAKFQGKTGLMNKVTIGYLSYYLNRLYGKGVEQEAPSVPWTPEPRTTSDAMIEKAAALLRQAKKPLLVIGSQAVMMRKDFTSNNDKTNSSNPTLDAVITAISKLGIPSFLAGGARGCLGIDDNNAAAKWHIRHKRAAALKQADVVVLLGVPCDFRLNYGFIFRRNTHVVSVNLDSKLLYLNKWPTLAILGEVPDFLIRLEKQLNHNANTTTTTTDSRRAEWEAWRVQLQQECDKRDSEIQLQSQVKLPNVQDDTGKSLSVNNPLAICLALNQSLRDDSILVCDGGDFIGTVAYTVRPRKPLSWVDPGPFGTLGVGAGFALGAKLVRPNADVWLLWGDGSSAYSLMEYDTFVRHKIAVIGVIGNDACWRQIHRDQVQTFDQDDVSCMLAYSDYHQVAQALGGKGYLVTGYDNMTATIDKAYENVKHKTPVLINVWIGKTNFRDGSISV